MKPNNIGVKNFITDLFHEQKKKAKRNHQRICHKLIETNRRCDILNHLWRWKKPKIFCYRYFNVTILWRYISYFRGSKERRLFTCYCACLKFARLYCVSIFWNLHTSITIHQTRKEGRYSGIFCNFTLLDSMYRLVYYEN